MAEADPTCFVVRSMKEDDIHPALQVLRDVSMMEDFWSLSENSIRTWYKIDPKGFFVAETNEGEVVGVCSAVLQWPGLLFIGIYSVKQRWQKKGIGMSIWRNALQYVGERNAGLNAVPTQISNYLEKGGFPLNAKWNSTYWISQTSCDVEIDEEEDPTVTIKDLSQYDIHLKDVIQYDENIVGFSRSDLVSRTVSENESLSMVAVRKMGNVEKVCGYGSIKVNLAGGAVISPLYADSPLIAQILLSKLNRHFSISQRPGLCMMITDRNKDAVDLAKKFSLGKCLEMARLYRKYNVEANFSKIYSQYSLDFSIF